MAMLGLSRAATEQAAMVLFEGGVLRLKGDEYALAVDFESLEENHAQAS